VPRLKKSRAIPLIHLWAFVARYRAKFTFTFTFKTAVSKSLQIIELSTETYFRSSVQGIRKERVSIPCQGTNVPDFHRIHTGSEIYLTFRSTGTAGGARKSPHTATKWRGQECEDLNLHTPTRFHGFTFYSVNTPKIELLFDSTSTDVRDNIFNKFFWYKTITVLTKTEGGK
jgi:hypothetical protein